MKITNENESISKLLKKDFIILIIFIFLIPNLSFSKDISLVISTFHPTWKYYHDLVKKSLEADGYKVHYKYLESTINQNRIMHMLNNGEGGPLFLWRSRNSKRDKGLVPIRVDIGDKMLGMRVLFIRKGEQSKFDNVETLEDFKKLKMRAGFSPIWSDVKVWKHNNLPVTSVNGDWRRIYLMLKHGGRGIDYFSRGIFEIFIEHKQHPELDIEKNLLFIYKKELTLYFSRPYAHLQPIMEAALNKAKKSGLMKKVMLEHFPEVFRELNKRKIINISVP